MIRVLIADDNAVIRQGVRALLTSSADDIEVVGEASTGREAIDQAEALRPDVVLLDIRMPVMDGVKAAERLATQCKVMMLTYSDDEPMVAGAIRAGAHGYLVHGRFEPDELTRAVRDLAGGKRIVSPSVAPVIFELIARGENHEPATRRDSGPDALTEREREVMTSISRGRSNRDIANELVISEKTVKNHIRAIYDKLGVGSRAEAMAVWLGIEREERR
ncbi:MAG TPA: response regulator transcription factor [Baekduia sp.]|nr:response regulator transcription factor [Solirubrobacteraceae bacterium]HWH94397.1 response regulator transcription factor [Baekduia sp.]